MANPHRGGVAVRAGERDLTFSFSTNAMCELEDVANLSFNEIMASLRNPQTVRMSLVRQIVWAALRDHHEDVSLQEAGEIMTEVGPEKILSAIGQTFTRSLPDAEAKPGKANPRRAKVG